MLPLLSNTTIGTVRSYKYIGTAKATWKSRNLWKLWTLDPQRLRIIKTLPTKMKGVKVLE
jgi:hypothetical protein